jgi:hypothetical protein
VIVKQRVVQAAKEKAEEDAKTAGMDDATKNQALAQWLRLQR